ncbi:hypothetical protein ACFL6C_04265 [Myxococcota bacterium]
MATKEKKKAKRTAKRGSRQSSSKKAVTKRAHVVSSHTTPRPPLEHVLASKVFRTWYPVAHLISTDAQAVHAVEQALRVYGRSFVDMKVLHKNSLPWPTEEHSVKARVSTPTQQLYLVRYSSAGKTEVAATGTTTWVMGPVAYESMSKSRRNEILLELFIGWQRVQLALEKKGYRARAARDGQHKNKQKLERSGFSSVRLVDALRHRSRNYQMFVGQKQGTWYYVSDNERQFGIDEIGISRHPLCYYLGLEFEAYGNPLARIH